VFVPCAILSLCLACNRSPANSGNSQNANAHSPVSESTPPNSPVMQPSFELFWQEFQKAVRQNDQATLYSLTRHSKFSWEIEKLDLERHGEFNYYFRFGSENDFLRVYNKIFSAKIKERILTSVPKPFPTSGYNIYWREKSGSYTGFQQSSLTIEKKRPTSVQDQK